jgi:ankyrin repeat protein
MNKVNSITEAIPKLIMALFSGDLPMVGVLLDTFPRLLELRDRRGRTLLMMAAYIGNPTIINYLISFYVIANPILDPNVEDEDGLNAHDWAVLGGSEFSRSLLIKVMGIEE